MKRFHVHLSVKNLSESIDFYSKLFGSEPTVTKGDYAKWMLNDPRINFAISDRDGTPGVNHLGVQVDSDAELVELRSQAERANIDTVAEPGAACCYAKSDKHWIEDPQGIAWETFHTLGNIPVFGQASLDSPASPAAAVRCDFKVDSVPVKAKSTCCG